MRERAGLAPAYIPYVTFDDNLRMRDKYTKYILPVNITGESCQKINEGIFEGVKTEKGHLKGHLKRFANKKGLQ